MCLGFSEEFPKNILWKYFIVGITINFLERVHCTLANMIVSSVKMSLRGKLLSLFPSLFCHKDRIFGKKKKKTKTLLTAFLVIKVPTSRGSNILYRVSTTIVVWVSGVQKGYAIIKANPSSDK